LADSTVWASVAAGRGALATVRPLLARVAEVATGSSTLGPVNELENRWRELGEFIREQRRVGHLSLRKLSEMAGISNPYLSQIERGLRKPSAEILQQIARALEISSETLYIRAGILEEREGDSDLVGEIRRDGWISEEQKRTLIQIYESFRRATGVTDGGRGTDTTAESSAAGER
jgi:transcriptional regulator with XRE-family HTH domain